MKSRTVALTGRACAAALFLSSGSVVLASGFSVPEISIAGLGLSNAMVADTRQAGALPYNPAVAAFLGKASLGGGLMLLKPDIKVSDTLFNEGESFDSEGKSWIGTAMGHGHYTFGEDLSLVLSINTPLGLETRWPSEAFGPGFSAVGAPGKEPTHSQLELVSASPSLTYRINENAAISGGLDLYWTRKLKFNTADTTITNNSVDSGTGFHLSGLYRHGDWSFGATYFSTAAIDIDGKLETGGVKIPVKTTFDLPWRAQVGVHYRATENLGIEFDITRTGWSKFDKLEIDHASLPVNLVTSVNNWNDANAYRLGVTYSLSDATDLRFGYSYDETPQDDEYFSARIPDADRHLFSVGFSHGLAGGWDIEGGYMYVMFEDRSLELPPPTGGDPNGTMLYNGDYSSSVHLLGLGVSKTF